MILKDTGVSDIFLVGKLFVSNNLSLFNFNIHSKIVVSSAQDTAPIVRELSMMVVAPIENPE